MFENRTLGRGESLLRHPSGATNLCAHPGAWFAAGPKEPDEVWRISGFECMVAGPGLLRALHQLGGPGNALVMGVDVHDPAHGVIDFAALSLHTTDRGEEWNAGTHIGTTFDAEAGRHPDGSWRPGLRGVLPAPAGTLNASWRGPLNRFRYGRTIHTATWQADLLRDPSGATLASTRIFLDVATAGAAGLWTTVRVPVAVTAAELDAGRRDFSPALTGDAFRWVVEFDYGSTGPVGYDPLATFRTSVLYQLAAWIETTDPWWRFTSLAELLARASISRHPYPGGWQDTDDLLLVRLEAELDLRGEYGEKLRAQLTANSSITLFEIHPLTKLDLVP